MNCVMHKLLASHIIPAIFAHNFFGCNQTERLELVWHLEVQQQTWNWASGRRMKCYEKVLHQTKELTRRGSQEGGRRDQLWRNLETRGKFLHLHRFNLYTVLPNLSAPASHHSHLHRTICTCSAPFAPAPHLLHPHRTIAPAPRFMRLLRTFAPTPHQCTCSVYIYLHQS